MRTFMAQRNMDSMTKIGLSLHTAFNSVKKAWEKFGADHVVFCGEGRSWRKDYDTAYKRNRSEKRALQTPAEKEEMEDLFTMMNEFTEFIDKKTNCTWLQQQECEADDLVAGWIQTHPEDMHYIISTDKDFHQLLSNNVQQFNPTQDFTYTINGVFDPDGGIAQKKKGKDMVDIECPDPEFSLFEKCIRGDKGDNVFPAYPGARMKSSKKAVGITEAYEDRINKGYAWNSFMNVKFPDKDDLKKDISVKTMYDRNMILVDLTAQPAYIKEKMAEVIEEKKNDDVKKMIGIQFLRFTEMYDLKNLQQWPDKYVAFLSARNN
ncbi:PIN domain-like protein [Vibrio phage 2.275.O._10N.286.54.E11]|nr:PIN domain-like protein [Vibrio phage 2.275.O._10N.286.54.E11]